MFKWLLSVLRVSDELAESTQIILYKCIGSNIPNPLEIDLGTQLDMYVCTAKVIEYYALFISTIPIITLCISHHIFL